MCFLGEYQTQLKNAAVESVKSKGSFTERLDDFVKWMDGVEQTINDQQFIVDDQDVMENHLEHYLVCTQLTNTAIHSLVMTGFVNWWIFCRKSIYQPFHSFQSVLETSLHLYYFITDVVIIIFVFTTNCQLS